MFSDTARFDRANAKIGKYPTTNEMALDWVVEYCTDRYRGKQGEAYLTTDFNRLKDVTFWETRETGQVLQWWKKKFQLTMINLL